ncbi:MAG: hypothetical protein PUP92_23665 [Rhizonema sp. PD38]|nr:hypothetical protein [Rhizonema sp. PD38]
MFNPRAKSLAIAFHLVCKWTYWFDNDETSNRHVKSVKAQLQLQALFIIISDQLNTILAGIQPKANGKNLLL